MTTIDLYRKHKAGDISREKFLYEVRRDEQLPWITNLTSYDDAVKILKNKGVVTEAKTEEPAKPKAKKASKTLTLDYVNPYQFRHGLVYELEQLGDHSDESLAKAKEKVLKNLTKDPTYYTTLLNQKQSSYEFKSSETDAPGMQANADGTLKKGAGKLDKSNVKDTLGKKEAGDKTPKGVKTMPDKGVTGTQKTIKESLFNEEGGNIKIEKQPDGKYYWAFTSKSGKTNKSYDGFNTSAEAQKDFMYRSKYLKEEEVDVNFENTNETQFEDLMKKYDWYYEMSDNAQKYDAGKLVDRQLQALGSKIGVDKATEIFNRYAPADRKVTSTFFSINESEVKVDKHAKLKELLKAKLKEAISVTDIQNSKISGKPINVSKSNAQDIKALQTAKANFTTYE
jgi:hypothetical protein